MRRIYLDNNATTPLAPEVFEAMKPYLASDYGNASSIHWFGQNVKAAVETAREQVARLLGARAREIVLTSGGTEADNLAIFGILGAARQKEKHIITSSIEHHAVMNAGKALEQQGVEVTYLRVGSEGIVDPDDVGRAIRPETVLISIMHANNEIGTIQPVPEIARIAAEHDIYFHTDAVQSAGKIPLNVEELGVDLLSLSAHKIHGPQGVGALYVRRGTPLRPLLYGGHHERDRRAGTENVAGAVGFGKAAEMAANPAAGEIEGVARLRDQLESGILANVPQVRINGDPQRRLPSTSNLEFSYVEGEGFVIAMDLKGVACSTGAACSSGSLEPSHVMSAIRKTADQARSSIRFSLSRFNTMEDIQHTLEILPGVVEHLRSLSPRYKKPVAV
ncbi:MAG: cysteine desulfurase NifS [Acidobacteria bacterium]|nr:cysteine desulfurase NifS [Acidobacteriota bacterium]